MLTKHVEKLSDEKTIHAIQENPYMQYLPGLEKFTEKPVFVPELFVLVRKRLDHDFFNMLTLMLAETDGSKPKKEHTDEDGNDHGGTMKIDATCCNAEVRYPTDSNLLEDGSRLIDRLLDKFCARHKVKKPQTHRTEARKAFIELIKKKRKGKKLIDKTKLIQIRCLQADFQLFLDFLGKQSSTLLACFSRHDYKCLQAAFKMYEQQRMMFEQNVRRCADRIISIYQPHLRPIVRGKAKAKVEFGAKVDASTVSGYTYLNLPEPTQLRCLYNGLIKCRDYIFNFLEDPVIPPYNNASEQGIRKLKTKLKNSCTFPSVIGSDEFLNYIRQLRLQRNTNKPF